MKPLIACLFLATGLSAQSFTCGVPVTRGDVTAICVGMPYRMLSAGIPGIFGTAKADAIQFYVSSPDGKVAAYRITVKFAGLDNPVSQIAVSTGAFLLAEFPVADLNSVAITSLKIEKFYADPALDFIAP
jgi:hypothetical protein